TTGTINQKTKKFVISEIEQKYLSYETFLLEIEKQNLTIYDLIVENTVYLKEICKNYRGLPINRYCVKEKSKNSIICLKGKDIQPFYIRDLSYLPQEHYTEKGYFTDGNIILQRIIAHVTKPRPHIIITATLNPGYANLNTITNIHLKNIDKISNKMLLLLLNSEIACWYVYLFIFSRAIRSMDLVGEYLNKVRIPEQLINKKYPIIEKIVEIYCVLVKLKSLQGNKEKNNTIIRYFQNLLNDIAFELFLKDNLKSNLIEIIESIELTSNFDFDIWFNKLQFEPMTSWNINFLLIKKMYTKLTQIKNIKRESKIIRSNKFVKHIKGDFQS
ncbi:MAG: hypothetical protein ACXAC7_19185, partial [Candidatus Hodarchaeales archaeon]